jgi:cytochrome P450
LRFRPPFIGPAPRFARTDVEFKGVVIPEGTFLLLACSANFDHSTYSQPEAFDVRRFADGAATKLRPAHFTLGHGWHSCIGAFLARVEMQEALRAMVQRMPDLRIDDSDAAGIEWNAPYGIHGPCRLPIRWD